MDTDKTDSASGSASPEHSTAVDAIKCHTILQTIYLHLAPGVLALVLHILIVDWFSGQGWPIAFTWHVVVNIVCFVPFILGELYVRAKRRGNRGFSLEGVVVYRQVLSKRSVLGWTLAILLATAPIFFILGPFTEWLSQFFTWIPKTDYNFTGEFSTSLIAVTFGLTLLFTGIVVPIVEEVYYRGYLLPRMPKQFGRAGPLVHSFLFAIHHPQSAWMVLVRTIGLLPLIYVTKRTGSLLPAIFSHCLVNVADVLDAAYSKLD